jgi:cytochrome c-type biogenesis protein CcmH/NrfG
VNNLAIGLLGAVLATNQLLAASNLVQQQTGASVAVASPDDPAEQELQKLMIADDAAKDEVDQWIQTNNTLVAQGAGVSQDELNKKIRERLDLVRKGYEDFLLEHPNSARGYLAYGSFLDDLGEEGEAKVKYENSRQLDPKNPAAWNDLANYYGEHGPVTNAFVYYAEAIRLNPVEPVYYQNLGMTVYLFRKDAMEFYRLTEPQVFDKALALYQQAVRLDPDNFALATDYAQSYYGIKPLRTNDALLAWTNALHTAHDDFEREGVFIHLARIKIAAGFFAEARAQLDAVTNAAYAELKDRLEKNLAAREHPPASPPPATVPTNVVAATNNFAPGPANMVTAAPNEADVSTDLMAAPPPLRRQ